MWISCANKTSAISPGATSWRILEKSRGLYQAFSRTQVQDDSWGLLLVFGLLLVLGFVPHPWYWSVTQMLFALFTFNALFALKCITIPLQVENSLKDMQENFLTSSRTLLEPFSNYHMPLVIFSMLFLI